MTSSPGRVIAHRTASGGPIPESMHHVHVAVTRPDGSLLARIGDPHRVTPLRSCAKPFQAQCLFLTEAAERFAVRDEEVALACASHEGSERHLAIVRGWLARLGLAPADLGCGGHLPGDASEARRLAVAGEEPSDLHNNCSGKHTGMLAAALALGAPTRDYLRANHPVQELIRQTLERLAGAGRALPSAYAVDGCSAPTAVMSVQRLATMFALLAAPDALGGALEPRLVQGLGRARQAMMTYADLVAGIGVFDTVLMRAVQHVVAKRGADGVYGVAVAASAHGPLGIALKVEDGRDDARSPAITAVLEQLGILNPASRVALAPFIRPRRLNVRGLVVGHWDATELELSWT